MPPPARSPRGLSTMPPRARRRASPDLDSSDRGGRWGDPVLIEAPGVLSKTELVEPVRNLPHRGPLNPSRRTSKSSLFGPRRGRAYTKCPRIAWNRPDTNAGQVTIRYGSDGPKP